MLSHPSVPVSDESTLGPTIEQKNLGVSTNNIPILDSKEYNIQLIRSVNRFVNKSDGRYFSCLTQKPKERGRSPMV